MIRNRDRCDHLPSLGQRIPIAGAALPPEPPRGPDVVGNLRRTQAAKGRPKAPPRRCLTPGEDAALRAICRIPDAHRRAIAYAALAEETGVALRSIEVRAWWLRTEAGL